MTAIELSSEVGLVAVGLATSNICLGLLIAGRYSPVRFWPHRRINIFAIHTWSAYLLLASILLHPMILMFSGFRRFRLIDIVFPVWSPGQPVKNSVGAAGLVLLLVVVITSFFRLSLGRRIWKGFHYLVYAAALSVFIHSTLEDPTLRGMPVNFLDGEKIFVEFCGCAVVGCTLLALRYRLAHKLPSRGTSSGETERSRVGEVRREAGLRQWR